MHALGPGHHGIEGNEVECVIADNLKNEHDRKQAHEEINFLGADGQDIAKKKLLHIPGHTGGTADNSKAESHHCGKNHADGHI